MSTTSHTSQGDNDRVIRRPELERLTGLSTSTLYGFQRTTAKQYDPTFPRAVKLTGRAVGWRLGEVRAWLAQRGRVENAAATGTGDA